MTAMGAGAMNSNQQQPAASEARVFLSGGLVACDIVSGGQLVFTVTVPQFELWKLRAALRERKDIDRELKLRALQKLERIEAEIWRRVEEIDSRQVNRTDWVLGTMVLFHLVAVTGLLAWFVVGLFLN